MQLTGQQLNATARAIAEYHFENGESNFNGAWFKSAVYDATADDSEARTVLQRLVGHVLVCRSCDLFCQLRKRLETDAENAVELRAREYAATLTEQDADAIGLAKDALSDAKDALYLARVYTEQAQADADAWRTRIRRFLKVVAKVAERRKRADKQAYLFDKMLFL